MITMIERVARVIATSDGYDVNEGAFRWEEFVPHARAAITAMREPTEENETMQEQTLGDRRVRASFNPSKDSAVDRIKHATAMLIDICEEMKSEQQGSEALRLLALAQTAYEEAAMWAVKAATAGKP